MRKFYPFNRSAARRGKGISDSAAADLIASNAPLRNCSHKARQNGPKHYPGDSRGRSPLARLSPLSFVVQRKMGPPEVVARRTRLVKTQNKTIAPPEVVGLVERLVKKRTAKDIATGGRCPPNAAGKNVTTKDTPPKGVGLAER